MLIETEGVLLHFISMNLDDAFFPTLQEFAQSINTPAEYLLRALWLESRLEPGPKSHRAGSQYYGLNQLNAGFLRARNIDPNAYLQMSASEQLRNGVIPYWKAQLATGIATPLRSPGVVQAIQLAPGRVKDGAPSRVLYQSPDPLYTANKGVDANRDGAITIGDLDYFFDVIMPKQGDWPIYQTAVARLNDGPPAAATTATTNKSSMLPTLVGFASAGLLVGTLGYAAYTYANARSAA